MEHDILQNQIAYYRARAQEYDETTEGVEELNGAFARARDLLQQRGPFEHILELACGTGAWTQVLLAMGQDITALDAAPEMLTIAQQKLADARVHYQQVDLFAWKPTREYHLVFFANWLSHVRPQELVAFLTKVAHAVRPGGYMAIVDQYAPMLEDREIAQEGEGGRIYALRPLRSGETFTIVKVFYKIEILQEVFTSLGFDVSVHQLNNFFFFLEARNMRAE